MKMYYVRFRGHNQEGHFVVNAETERKAYNRAVSKIKEHGLWDKNKDRFSKDSMYELDKAREGVLVSYDGDN